LQDKTQVFFTEGVEWGPKFRKIILRKESGRNRGNGYLVCTSGTFGFNGSSFCFLVVYVSPSFATVFRLVATLRNFTSGDGFRSRSLL